MCNCSKYSIEVPENIEWGPLFWKILHGLAERSGSSSSFLLRKDEHTLWKQVLTTLSSTLPCSECRDHLREYILVHPIQIPDTFSNLHTYIQTWIYNLHEDVNLRLSKPSYPFASLEATPDIRTGFLQLQVVMERAARASSVPFLSWKKWSNSVKMLMSIYGI